MNVRVTVSLDLAGVLPNCTDRKFLDIIRFMCESIDTEGVIDLVREIVNDPQYSDQEVLRSSGALP